VENQSARNRREWKKAELLSVEKKEMKMGGFTSSDLTLLGSRIIIGTIVV
jgi:hypothetical protein